MSKRRFDDGRAAEASFVAATRGNGANNDENNESDSHSDVNATVAGVDGGLDESGFEELHEGRSSGVAVARMQRWYYIVTQYYLFFAENKVAENAGELDGRSVDVAEKL